MIIMFSLWIFFVGEFQSRRRIKSQTISLFVFNRNFALMCSLEILHFALLN